MIGSLCFFPPAAPCNTWYCQASYSPKHLYLAFLYSALRICGMALGQHMFYISQISSFIFHLIHFKEKLGSNFHKKTVASDNSLAHGFLFFYNINPISCVDLSKSLMPFSKNMTVFSLISFFFPKFSQANFGCMLVSFHPQVKHKDVLLLCLLWAPFPAILLS